MNPYDGAVTTTLTVKDLRILRSALLAGLSTTTSVFAHVAAGGEFPPTWLTISITGILWAGAYALSSRALTLLQVLAVTGFGQILINGALASAHSPANQCTQPIGQVIDAHSGAILAESGPLANITQVMSMTPMMAAAHVLATLLLTLAVAGAEKAWDWLISALNPGQNCFIRVLLLSRSSCCPVWLASTPYFGQPFGRAPPAKHMFSFSVSA